MQSLVEKNSVIQEKYSATIKEGEREFTEKLMEAARNANILEIGCGGNCMAHSIARVCRSVTTIDESEAAVSTQKKKSAENGISNSKFITMDIKRLDFDNCSFDVIFGRGIIHHLDARLSFFQIVEALKPDGRVLFWEPLRDIKSNIEVANMYFRDVNVRLYGLSGLVSMAFPGGGFSGFLLRIISAIDRAILVFPGLKSQAHCLIELKNPRRNEIEYSYYLS